MIVSPNTTEALTPAVEKACQAGLPVVVFDRGVSTDCPVTFVHPIGGYAFGATDADFIAPALPQAATMLAVGAYGRGQTFPYSGADVVILVDSVPDSDSVRAAKSALTRVLWDSGLRATITCHGRCASGLIRPRFAAPNVIG